MCVTIITDFITTNDYDNIPSSKKTTLSVCTKGDF